MKYLLFSFLISSLIVGFSLIISAPCFAELAQDSEKEQESLQPGQTFETPKSLEEAETFGRKLLWVFPQTLKLVCQEAWSVWKKMLNWFRGFWNSYILSWFKNIWFKIKFYLGWEVGQKKPEIKKELEEEKQEIKEGVPKACKSLWQRFKELIE